MSTNMLPAKKLRAVQGAIILIMFLGAFPLWAQTREPSEDIYMRQVRNHALETQRSGTQVPWTNPYNGHHGCVTPFSAFQSEIGEPCRRYKKTWFKGQATSTYEGVACRNAGGIWSIRQERQVRSEPGSKEGSVSVTDKGMSIGAQPASVDWKNTQYTLDCAGNAPLKIDVHNGHGDGPRDNDYSNGYIVRAEAVTRPQDLTGDGKPETAVLLYCSPQPSNFFVQEVQVFTDGSKLLAKPKLDPLLPTDLSPVFDSSEFTIRDGKLVTGVRYYAATDSHASGPSIHRVLTWRWNGQGFETEKRLSR